jgi:hypothetical protein
MSPTFYRTEAARCRALAQSTNDPIAAARWDRIASDYKNLANSLEDAPFFPPLVHVAIQQQPMEQQQSKTQREDAK